MPRESSTCRLCGQSGISRWLDFGPQALTNRFLRSDEEAAFTWPCRLGVCRACGVMQLESPVPVDEMRPRFPWISYNEPEAHLDEVVGVLARLPGLSAESRIGALTYKDDSALQRLAKLGFTRTWRAEPQRDLGIASPLGGIESIQDALTEPNAKRLAERYGRPDLLLVRHVLEHSYDIQQTFRFARQLAAPGGAILFELPDVTKAIDRRDFTTVWEEHQFYFTTATLRDALIRAGFEIVYLNRFYYSQEDVLVAVVRCGTSSERMTDADRLAEVERGEQFLEAFPAQRDRMRRLVGGFGGRVAMLGAGHHSAAFINLYGLSDLIDFVADDNPNKQGLFMPGSNAPILPASELISRGIGLCLMSVRAEIEDAVANKNAAFTAYGGILASIYPESPRSLEKVPAARAA
jgi:hypothetical protein